MKHRAGGKLDLVSGSKRFRKCMKGDRVGFFSMTREQSQFSESDE